MIGIAIAVIKTTSPPAAISFRRYPPRTARAARSMLSPLFARVQVDYIRNHFLASVRAPTPLGALSCMIEGEWRWAATRLDQFLRVNRSALDPPQVPSPSDQEQHTTGHDRQQTEEQTEAAVATGAGQRLRDRRRRY